jgi:hypothetical protein
MVLKSKFSNPLICKKRMESYSFESLNYNNIKNKICKTEIKELSITEYTKKKKVTVQPNLFGFISNLVPHSNSF